jgi:pyridoxal phosphate enzyme (YggS family)
MAQFLERYAAICRRIEEACRRSRRNQESVTLIGVTKTLSGQRVREAIVAGLRDLGESRVQEARDKRAQLALPEGPLRWHLIGHLQRNKAKLAAQLFDAVHSVDTLTLAQDLDAASASRKQPLDIFIQVNVSGRSTKFGCLPQEAATLAAGIGACTHLSLLGLMTLAPLEGGQAAAREAFRRLAEIRDQAARSLSRQRDALKLSMGMSDDFEIAIEEGAHFIRVGRALFGER